jgi:hypothetical protein
MRSDNVSSNVTLHNAPLRPAEPLWQLAPTRRSDGRGLADFMMLIPGMATAGDAGRRHVSASIQAVCEGFGEAVVFAEINYRLNILWVSVDAEPGLTGRVASAVRERIPDALLVGGQLGAIPTLPVRNRVWRNWIRTLRALPLPIVARLPGRVD